MVVRIWDALADHVWFVTPVCLIVAVACLAGILLGHPTGLPLAEMIGGYVISSGLVIAFPCYGWSENHKVRQRIQKGTTAEKELLLRFADREISTVTAWPHEVYIAVLVADKVLRRLPDALPGQLGVFGLTPRATKQVDKEYRR